MKRVDVWGGTHIYTDRYIDSPIVSKRGGENDISATATSGMALPRVTRGNGGGIVDSPSTLISRAINLQTGRTGQA